MITQSSIIKLANVCNLWPLSAGAQVTLINESENRTYLVTATDDCRYVLREHRPDYHSLIDIQSELQWLEALRNECDINVPVVIRGTNNAAIQTVNWGDANTQRHLVLFEFIEGKEPVDDDNLLDHFSMLGSITARMHMHSSQWIKPENFSRREWNINTVLRPEAAWGHWLDGPEVDRSIKTVLSSLQDALQKRLINLGMGNDVYGLIHADMRRANLLLTDNTTSVIDFDDCGFSWYLYDFATAVSFIEDHPQMDDMRAHWLAGYRRHRPLSRQHESELNTLVLFRRLALLGWMGTHPEVDIVKQLSPTFAQGTAVLAEHYLTVVHL